MNRHKPVKILLLKIFLALVLQLFWIMPFLYSHPNQSFSCLLGGFSQQLTQKIQKVVVSVQSLHLNMEGFSPFSLNGSDFYSF